MPLWVIIGFATFWDLLDPAFIFCMCCLSSIHFRVRKYFLLLKMVRIFSDLGIPVQKNKELSHEIDFKNFDQNLKNLT